VSRSTQQGEIEEGEQEMIDKVFVFGDKDAASVMVARPDVVALSVDQQGVPIARRFFSEIGIKTLPLYVDPSAKAAFTIDAAGLPATLLVDRAGREIGRHLGAVKWDSPEVLAQLRRAISAE